MELAAAEGLLEALAKLPRPAGLLKARTDSRYVIDGLNRYLPYWQRNGWRTRNGDPVKNKDLWERLAAAAAAVAWVELAWVRGHNGDPDNERADALASAAAAAVEMEMEVGATIALPAAPLQLLPQHLAELQASAIPADLAAANVASWGLGTLRHCEDERAEVVRHARLRI